MKTTRKRDEPLSTKSVITKTIQTYNHIAHDYCRKTRQLKFLGWEETYIQKMLSLLNKVNPLVLDVGCGDGRHCFLVDKNEGRAIGVDLSQNMLKEAKIYYPAGLYCVMDMCNLHFRNDCFDGIWSSGSIYHVPKSQVQDVVVEFKRILKEDGVVAVNFKLGKGEGMETNPKSYKGEPRYFAYYTEREMQEIFYSIDFLKIDSCLYPEDIFGDKIIQMWFRLTHDADSDKG